MKIKVPNGIDNEGRQVFNEVEIETEEARLLVKIDTLAEALRFYAEEQIYQVYSEGIPTEAEQDSGRFAREALAECGL